METEGHTKFKPSRFEKITFIEKPFISNFTFIPLAKNQLVAFLKDEKVGHCGIK